jgi:hypothetical protein
MIEFKAFPKIKRLVGRDGMTVTVTEKIDGTNGLLMIRDGEMLVGSRSREIFPNGSIKGAKGTDNFGFAAWAREHATELLTLGNGDHYGEWYGEGIQRQYGLDYKQFALFNTHRPAESLPKCVSQVPILYQGDYKGIDHIMELWNILATHGSLAAPTFMNPEGLMVFFHGMRQYLKLPITK